MRKSAFNALCSMPTLLVIGSAAVSITVANAAVDTTPVTVTADISPGVGNAPLTVSFSASVFGGTTPYTFSWDFKDGQTSSEQNPTHTYSTAATYRAVVTARDSTGLTATALAVISVRAPSSDTTPPTTPQNLMLKVFSSTRIDLKWSASSDNEKLTNYLVYRNGIQIAETSIHMYQDDTLSPSTTYTYAVKARDAAGNVSALSPSATAKTAAPPPPTLTGQIDLPLKKWTALLLPDYRYENINGLTKHVDGQFNPENGRIYYAGGDFGDYKGWGPEEWHGGYRQDIHSVSLVERMSNRGNPTAGWRIEHSYCGSNGEVIPGHPDWIGWTWDQNRRVFWMVPGLFFWNDFDNCIDEPGPRFRVGTLMMFDPRTRRWTDTGSIGGHVARGAYEPSWATVHDPVTDTIIQFAYGGGVSIYNPRAKTWAWYPLANGPDDREVDIAWSRVAPDFKNRVIYALDPYKKRLYRYRMDAKTIEHLGPLPSEAVGETSTGTISIYAPMHWDPINEVAFWKNGHYFYAYHPDTATWERLSVESDIAGIYAYPDYTQTFDPQQNALVVFGEVWGAPGSASERARPYMFLYRYGAGGTMPPPPGLRGDLNSDGQVTLADLRYLIKMFLGLVPIDLAAADLTGDGALTLADLRALVGILVGGGG